MPAKLEIPEGLPPVSLTIQVEQLFKQPPGFNFTATSCRRALALSGLKAESLAYWTCQGLVAAKKKGTKCAKGVQKACLWQQWSMADGQGFRHAEHQVHILYRLSCRTLD